MNNDPKTYWENRCNFLDAAVADIIRVAAQYMPPEGQANMHTIQTNMYNNIAALDKLWPIEAEKTTGERIDEINLAHSERARLHSIELARKPREST